MKAIILAAGKGTRVRPITYAMPKPMMPILNTPVIELLVELLARHGLRQIMVNTSYLSPVIETYLRDGSRHGVEIAYSFEGRLEPAGLVDAPLGSAGALRKIQDHSGFFDQTFVVLNGDAVTDYDLTQLMAVHRAKGAVATLGLLEVPREEVFRYGVAVLAGDGRVLEFQEKPSVAEAKSTTINLGIYVLEPSVIAQIPAGTEYDLSGQLLTRLVREGAPVYGVRMPCQWLDIGKVTDYYRVMQQALRGQVAGVRVPGIEIAPGIHVGLNVRLDLARCRVTPPVYIGGSSAVEPGATLEGPTWIGTGCVIESGAVVERGVVFDYTRVGSAAHVRETIVCGSYSVDASEAIVNLEQSDIRWIISDSRQPKTPLRPDQQELLDLLQSLGQGR